MSEVTTVALDHLRETQYKAIVCYPKYSDEEFQRRIGELSGLGVVALEFQGSKNIFGAKVLGKGCVGIVVSALRGSERVALKILRTDAGRTGLEHEASMLKLANSANVGPALLGFSQTFLVTECVEGSLLPQWIQGLRGRGRKKRLEDVLTRLLEAGHRLDQVGLDHGELSRAPKHIIVTGQDEPKIVDFETASTKRRPANVTSIAQYLFIGSDLSKKIKRIKGPVGRRQLIVALKRYKDNRSSDNFKRVLRVVFREAGGEKRISGLS